MIHVRLLASLLLAILFAGPAHAGELGRLVEDLGGKDGRARSKAYHELIARRDVRALPILRKAMPTWARSGRYYGVLVLDRYPYEEVRRSWKRLLDAEPPYLRFSAANAMLRRGEKDVLAPLVLAIKDSRADATERIWMAARLPVDAPPEAIAALRGFVAPAQPPSVVAAVLRRMHVRRDQAAMIGATRILSSGSADLRALGAAYLLRMGDLARGPRLVEAYGAGVTKATLDLTQTFLDVLPRVPMSVLDGVAKILEEERHASLQLRWIAFLRRYRHAGASRLLEQLVHAKNDRVARAAFDALAAVSGATTSDTLRPLLEDGDRDRRLWAAEALRRRDDPSGLSIVILALQEGSSTQRVKAARLLGDYRSEACVEPLLDAMGDHGPAVRGQALRSLQRILSGLYPYRWLKLTSTGYAASADPAARAKALQAIRTWWEENRYADW